MMRTAEFVDEPLHGCGLDDCRVPAFVKAPES